MTLISILTGVFSGVIAGIGIGLLIFAFKKNRQIKNSIKRISKQQIKYIIDGKPHDFVGKIDKELKKKSDVPKPKTLAARVKSIRKPKEIKVETFIAKKKPKKVAFVGKSPGKRKKVKKK